MLLAAEQWLMANDEARLWLAAEVVAAAAEVCRVWRKVWVERSKKPYGLQQRKSIQSVTYAVGALFYYEQAGRAGLRCIT